MESAPEILFSALNQNNQKIHAFGPKKKGGDNFFDIFDPPQPNPPPPPTQKSGLQV